MAGGPRQYKDTLIALLKEAHPEYVHANVLAIKCGVKRNALNTMINTLRKTHGYNISNKYGGYFALEDGDFEMSPKLYPKVIDFFDKLDGDQFYYEDIIKHTGLTRQQVYSVLTKLESDGVYSVCRFYGSGPRMVIRH